MPITDLRRAIVALLRESAGALTEEQIRAKFSGEQLPEIQFALKLGVMQGQIKRHDITGGHSYSAARAAWSGLLS